MLKRLIYTLTLLCLTSTAFGAERVLYFGATWCGPCRVMKKVLKDKEVKKELDKLDFRMYDVDRDKDMARRYSIKSIPTIITIKDKKMRRYVGQLSKQKLLTILKELNKED